MTKATPESSDSLVFECDFDEPPEKVWRALTEPRLLDAWLTAGDTSLTDAAKGAERRDAADGADAAGADAAGGADAADRPDGADEVGELAERPASPELRRSPRGARDLDILTAEPHRFLRFRWRDLQSGIGDSGAREVDSVVTFELAPDPSGGTHLRLTHGEFRIVRASSPAILAKVRPIAMAIASTRRRNTPIVSFAAQSSLRRAA